MTDYVTLRGHDGRHLQVSKLQAQESAFLKVQLEISSTGDDADVYIPDVSAAVCDVFTWGDSREVKSLSDKALLDRVKAAHYFDLSKPAHDLQKECRSRLEWALSGAGSKRKEEQLLFLRQRQVVTPDQSKQLLHFVMTTRGVNLAELLLRGDWTCWAFAPKQLSEEERREQRSRRKWLAKSFVRLQRRLGVFKEGGHDRMTKVRERWIYLLLGLRANRQAHIFFRLLDLRAKRLCNSFLTQPQVSRRPVVFRLPAPDFSDCQPQREIGRGDAATFIELCLDSLNPDLLGNMLEPHPMTTAALTSAAVTKWRPGLLREIADNRGFFASQRELRVGSVVQLQRVPSLPELEGMFAEVLGFYDGNVKVVVMVQKHFDPWLRGNLKVERFQLLISSHFLATYQLPEGWSAVWDIELSCNTFFNSKSREVTGKLPDGHPCISRENLAHAFAGNVCLTLEHVRPWVQALTGIGLSIDDVVRLLEPTGLKHHVPWVVKTPLPNTPSLEVGEHTLYQAWCCKLPEVCENFCLEERIQDALANHDALPVVKKPLPHASSLEVGEHSMHQRQVSKPLLRVGFISELMSPPMPSNCPPELTGSGSIRSRIMFVQVPDYDDEMMQLWRAGREFALAALRDHIDAFDMRDLPQQMGRCRRCSSTQAHGRYVLVFVEDERNSRSSGGAEDESNLRFRRNGRTRRRTLTIKQSWSEQRKTTHLRTRGCAGRGRRGQ